jgi:hypothetical protein
MFEGVMHASTVARPGSWFQVPEVDLCGVSKSVDSVKCRRCYAVSLSVSIPILARTDTPFSPCKSILTPLQGYIGHNGR